MKWFAVNIYLEGRLPIETELTEEGRDKLRADWEAARLDYTSRIQTYEGRVEQEYRVNVGAGDWDWDTRYITSLVDIDLGEVVAIESHEAVDEKEQT